MGKCRPVGVTPGKPPPRPPTRPERGAAMGRGRQKGGDREASDKIRPAKTRECGAMKGAMRPPEWPTSLLEWGKRRGAARPPEWRKNHWGPAIEWAGESSRHRAPTPLEWQSFPGGDETSGAAVAGGRAARIGASGHKGLREEDRRSAGEGGRNGDETGRPRRDAETGRRTTATRRRMTAEQMCGRQGKSPGTGEQQRRRGRSPHKGGRPGGE